MPLKILQESNVEIIAKREMASQSYSDQTSTQLFHKGTIFYGETIDIRLKLVQIHVIIRIFKIR